MNYCVIIPTYNNSGTLKQVLERTLSVCRNVIVVNDGSTDGSDEILSSFGERIQLVAYQRNRGKGYALKRGFEKARKCGFRYAVTMDSDGQHYPEDIVRLLEPIDNSGSDKPILVVGCRNLNADGMPSKNSFANRFSNFWFRLQTGIRLDDTQSGFRLYDLGKLPWFGWVTNRYESELELLVFSAWNGVTLSQVPIRVYYPPEGERVSHFRPVWDFVRITILNTFLSLAAVFMRIRTKIIKP